MKPTAKSGGFFCFHNYNATTQKKRSEQHENRCEMYN